MVGFWMHLEGRADRVCGQIECGRESRVKDGTGGFACSGSCHL